MSAYTGACQCGGPRLIRGVIHVSTEVRDSLIDVGFVHIGTGNEGVSTLFGFPLRRIDADFTVAMAEQIMANATALSAAGWGIPVRAYHKNARAGSPLTGLPRGEILQFHCRPRNEVTDHDCAGACSGDAGRSWA